MGDRNAENTTSYGPRQSGILLSGSFPSENRDAGSAPPPGGRRDRTDGDRRTRPRGGSPRKPSPREGVRGGSPAPRRISPRVPRLRSRWRPRATCVFRGLLHGGSFQRRETSSSPRTGFSFWRRSGRSMRPHGEPRVSGFREDGS